MISPGPHGTSLKAAKLSVCMKIGNTLVFRETPLFKLIEDTCQLRLLAFHVILVEVHRLSNLDMLWICHIQMPVCAPHQGPWSASCSSLAAPELSLRACALGMAHIQEIVSVWNPLCPPYLYEHTL